MVHQKLRSTKEARDYFRENGISITDWCRENGLNRLDVYALLNGKSKGTRGKAHQAAVRLKLKAEPSGESDE